VSSPTATLPDPGAEPRAMVPLTDLAAGEQAWLLRVDLPGEDRALLDALGLVAPCRFRLCKSGDPWILQARGTRVGLSEAVARRLLVAPDAD